MKSRPQPLWKGDGTIDSKLSSKELKARSSAVKERAEECGFDVCGIAAAGEIDPEDRLGEWLRHDYHADMIWMASTAEVRKDIKRKLPGAESVIVVGRNYYADRPESGEACGRVSRYAWGRDYHNVLERPLRRLARFVLEAVPECRCYWSIDTGPVLERSWAAQAGIGWIGKNGLVLNKELGSWMFLAIIATTAELAPDKPVRNQCGSCRKCIDACPSGAIVAPGVVDSRRCISYLTIEHRGDIPSKVARVSDGWVFGCDACQEVCPWNKDCSRTSERGFLPRDDFANPDLEAWAKIDEKAFKTQFRGSPVRRAKHDGLQRNLKMAKAALRRAAKK